MLYFSSFGTYFLNMCIKYNVGKPWEKGSNGHQSTGFCVYIISSAEHFHQGANYTLKEPLLMK